MSRLYLKKIGEPLLPTNDTIEDEEVGRDGGTSFLRHMYAEKNARKLAMFLTMNVTYMFAEIIYGWWTNSLGKSPTLSLVCCVFC